MLGHTYMPDKPTRCSRGHRLHSGKSQYGYLHCVVHHGHAAWRCECGDLQMWPPKNQHCDRTFGMGPR